MNNRTVTMRHYDETRHYAMLCDWWLCRDGERRPKSILPRCGVVCELDGEPVASLFMFMDNSSGNCLLEHAASAPGLSLKRSLEGFRHCVALLKRIALTHGYHTMVAYGHPGVARVLSRQGFQQTNGGLAQMVAILEEEEQPCP